VVELALDGLGDHGVHDRLFRGEIVVEGAEAQVGRGGDLGNRRRFDALLGHHAPRRCHKLCPRLPASPLLPAAGLFARRRGHPSLL